MFDLQEAGRKGSYHLRHSSALGEFKLASDAITTRLLKRAKRVVAQVPPEQMPHHRGYTMGSALLPEDRTAWPHAGWHRHRHHAGLTGSLRHDTTKSGDFYLAKTGDLELATSGDFFMATDSSPLTRRFLSWQGAVGRYPTRSRVTW